jgi:hypothetical protein
MTLKKTAAAPPILQGRIWKITTTNTHPFSVCKPFYSPTKKSLLDMKKVQEKASNIMQTLNMVAGSNSCM